MFETYDTNQMAYVEHSGEYYDLNLKAWVPVNSAMTYDTTEKAWIERLYAGYFTLVSKTIQTGDILEVKNSGVVLHTFTTNLGRSVSFELPFKWKNSDVIEFDVITNSLGRITCGHRFNYNNGWTVGGGGAVFEDETNQHYVWDMIGSCPDTYEGYPVYDNCLYFFLGDSAENTTGETYAEIKNLTINGKKYGFKE